MKMIPVTVRETFKTMLINPAYIAAVQEDHDCAMIALVGNVYDVVRVIEPVSVINKMIEEV